MIIEKILEQGIDLKNRSRGQFKTVCPKCSHDRKHKLDPCLSVNIDEGAWTCHNCGWAGRVYEKRDKTYVLPTKNTTKLSDKTLAWFNKRGIGNATVMAWDVTESKHYFPQVQAERTAINFNYFRSGELINVKYRDAQKNFSMSKGAELIFYGLDKIQSNDSAIICEGEMDALAYYEANVLSVCSVPNGASKGAQKLEYLDNCIDEFKDFKLIYIATDNDEPGIALRNELARRLGKQRCRYIDFGDCKDANEYLLKYGADALKNTIEKNSKIFPVEGIVRVSDFKEKITSLRKNGFPKGYTVGDYAFDEHLRYLGGQWTMVAGYPYSGKSEVVDQIMISLAYRYGLRFGLFSSENMPYEFHFSKLAEKFCGKMWNTITDREHRVVEEFLHEHFFWINIQEANLSLEYILEKYEELVVTHGVWGFGLDPWNQIDHIIPHGMSETQYVSKALSKVTAFTQRTDSHVWIVAHPSKPQKTKDGTIVPPKLADISGSMNFANKTFNGFTVFRDFQNNTVIADVQKVKFKFLGKYGIVPLNWSGPEGGRYWALSRDVNYHDGIEPKKILQEDLPF